jgi:hypothetical protein
MTSEHNEPRNEHDVHEFPPALIHAEETAREALAEKLNETGGASTRQWLRPSLGAALLLIGAAALAYKVIVGYRHPSPDAFVSVEDQNKQPAASTANRSIEPPPAAADVTPPSVGGTVAAPPAPNTAAPPNTPKNDLENTSSGATDTNSAVQDDPACADIKTEQHEIDAALNNQHSSEQDHYMQRRLRELKEQSGKRKCAG